jgi:hypothetical protein
MSWESSADYYRLINEATRERLGGLHSADSLLRSVDFAEIEQLLVLCTNRTSTSAGCVTSTVWRLPAETDRRLIHDVIYRELFRHTRAFELALPRGRLTAQRGEGCNDGIQPGTHSSVDRTGG